MSKFVTKGGAVVQVIGAGSGRQVFPGERVSKGDGTLGRHPKRIERKGIVVAGEYVLALVDGFPQVVRRGNIKEVKS